MQRSNCNAEIGVRLRILLLQARANRRHLCLRLLESDAGVQTCHDLEVVPVTISSFVAGERNWDPQFVVVFGKLKTRRHHADNRITFIVESKCFADDR